MYILLCDGVDIVNKGKPQGISTLASVNGKKVSEVFFLFVFPALTKDGQVPNSRLPVIPPPA